MGSARDKPAAFEFTHLAAAVLAGSDYRDTAGNAAEAVVFEEYAGPVFQRLRDSMRLSQHSYIASFPELGSVIEFAANSKSAQRFFFSSDGRYMVKTMSDTEVASFMALLPHYAEHLRTHSASLLTRFLGLYRVTTAAGAAATFVVAANIFYEPPGVELVERYDLKGSRVGRRTRKTPGQQVKTTTVLKDLDLAETGRMRIGRRQKEALMSALRADAAFLASHDLMDYSLLVGVRAPRQTRPLATSNSGRPGHQETSDRDPVKPPVAPSSQLGNETAVVVDNVDNKPLQGESAAVVGALLRACTLPARLLARALRAPLGALLRRRTPPPPRRARVQLGLIDVLQRYSLRKTLETAAKGVVHDKHQISSVPPAEYAKRLVAFIDAHFE
ncbi:hypothetical protein JKP88DRAFT_323323 [Tribonema minus]|uniref:PIPK domain-containing protein n=1 Tax=Tribonema minus TaxID=303371 RepID=A0A835YSQ2_9STRA|nr:hypothetical protein JKP88DRAFT_323323 [Tribonema minus]